MAMAALLRSLAGKMARAAPPALLARGLHGGARSVPGGSWTHRRLLHQRGLQSLPTSAATPPSGTSKMDLAKIRAGVAYVTLFGAAVYLYGSVLPRLDRIRANLEARNRADLEARLALDEAIEAVNLLLADLVSTDVPKASGHGKQPVGETGKGTTHEDIQARIKDIQAEIAKLKIAQEAPSKGKV